jgi:hypothetical protein
VRTAAGRRTSSVRADDSGAGLGGDLTQGRIGAGRGVDEQVGTGLHCKPADGTTPGVDADHNLRVALPDRRHERHDPPDLLRSFDLRSGTCLNAANVDDVGAFADDNVDPGQRVGFGEGGASVAEGVRCVR